ncbi:ABC transporter permease [Geochorda subterranea]|uniref:ABC transporter permease n=1 Tax=Geochorda subterranea TaxID=3109564 RepID=A0ABZ1BSK7_9FIRM|nr:ABC transporter permease [Limnochorda sp. LNt]WRP15511.1 ABC transporter permease [Limnochorda sp. LNt]
MSRAVWVIARREWRALVSSRAYRFATLVGALALLALSLLPLLLTRAQQESPSTVAVVDEAGGVLEQMRAVEAVLPPALRPPVEWRPAGSSPMAEGARDLTLHIRRAADGELEWVVTGERVDDAVVRGLQQVATPVAVADRSRRLGIEPEVAVSLQAPARVRVESGGAADVTAGAAASVDGPPVGEIMALMLMLMLYMTLTLYGSVVVNGVTAEKGSRVVEMLLVAARPGELLRGKLLGIAAASLVQYAIWAAVGSIAFVLQRGALGAQLSQMLGAPVELQGIPLRLVGYLGLFFVLGFTSFGALFAASASLASRPEESSQTIWPPMVLIVAGYMLAVFSLPDPASRLAVVSSVLPFVGPLVMFVRIALAQPPLVDVALSVGVSTLTAYLTLRLAERVYRTSLLRMRRTSWSAALREGRGAAR